MVFRPGLVSWAWCLVFLNNLIGISATKCNGGPLSQAGRWGHESRPERYGRLATLVHSTSIVQRLEHLVYKGREVKTIPCVIGRKYPKALSSESISKGFAVVDVVRVNGLLRFYQVALNDGIA